ncbi:hypothetical protein ABZT03_34580 [Streptomyces sp. NPDC005574]|uniref:hypothetical protein n=1 Tax=Streptomyces sp. NPDC005574 TaxID=3156891 RepID=UPI0033B25C8F
MPKKKPTDAQRAANISTYFEARMPPGVLPNSQPSKDADPLTKTVQNRLAKLHAPNSETFTGPLEADALKRAGIPMEETGEGQWKINKKNVRSEADIKADIRDREWADGVYELYGLKGGEAKVAWGVMPHWPTKETPEPERKTRKRINGLAIPGPKGVVKAGPREALALTEAGLHTQKDDSGKFKIISNELGHLPDDLTQSLLDQGNLLAQAASSQVDEFPHTQEASGSAFSGGVNYSMNPAQVAGYSSLYPSSYPTGPAVPSLENPASMHLAQGSEFPESSQGPWVGDFSGGVNYSMNPAQVAGYSSLYPSSYPTEPAVPSLENPASMHLAQGSEFPESSQGTWVGDFSGGGNYPMNPANPTGSRYVQSGFASSASSAGGPPSQYQPSRGKDHPARTEKGKGKRRG